MATPYRPSRSSAKIDYHAKQLMDEAEAGGVAWDPLKDFDMPEMPEMPDDMLDDLDSELPYSPSRRRNFPPSGRYSPHSPDNGGEYSAYSSLRPGYSGSAGSYNPRSRAYSPTSPFYSPTSPRYSPSNPIHARSYSPPAIDYSSISRPRSSHSALKARNVADFLARSPQSHSFAPNRGPVTTYTPSAYKPPPALPPYKQVFRNPSTSPLRRNSTSPAASNKRASRWDQRPKSDLNQTASDQALIEGLMHENEELQREIKRTSPTKNSHDVLDVDFDDTAEPLDLGGLIDDDYVQAFDEVFDLEAGDGGAVDDFIFDTPAVRSSGAKKAAPKAKAASPKGKVSPSSSRAPAGMRRSSRIRNKAARK